MHCSRCGGRVVLDDTDKLIWSRCIACGNMALMDITVGGVTIRHQENPVATGLPKKGTKSHACLVSLASIFPASTEEVSEIVAQTNSDTASQLGVLAKKGLVERVKERRGVKGGSTWTLTQYSKKALNIA